MENTFQLVAKTFRGLEEVLRDELISLGAENVEIGTRMVSFTGDLELMYKANLCCRTALRILKPIAKFTAVDPDDLYDFVRDFNWEEYMSVDSTFSVDSTVNSAEFNHSKYVTYRVKDGIADHFRDLCGSRPSIRLENADLQLNVHIYENRVTISLDSSGEPLNKRGYRVEQTEAPINEVLAAGIIMLSGWHGETDFADPMCGSGTFPIEAALIAGNINPGIYRENFAFEKWRDFDADLFESLYNDDSAEREISCKILCGDKDPDAVRIARKNIKAARLDQNISIVCRPMQEWDENENPGGTLITNPPYGERLRPDDMENLYHQIGDTLKFHFQGWNAWILGYKDEHFSAIGLKPSVKYPILNGALECSLREYVIFEGKYNDFRAEGGSVKNHNISISSKRPSKHISDSDWEEETRRFDKKGDAANHRKERKERGDRFDKKGRPERFGSNDRSDRFDRKGRPDRFENKDRGDRFDRKGRSGKDAPRKGNFSRQRHEDALRTNTPIQIQDRGPRLGKEATALHNPVYMRSRKSRKNSDEETD